MLPVRALRIGFMLWGLATWLAPGGCGQRLQFFPVQPSGTEVRATRADAAGYVYVAGNVTPSEGAAGNTGAFVARFAPDGTPVFRTLLDGSGADSATAIALGSDGTVYVTGTTMSPDFPTTSGVIQPAPGAAGTQAFLAHLSGDGRVLAATYFGAGARTAGTALAVDSEGDVYLTGTSSAEGFPATSGYSGAGYGFFLTKVNAGLSAVRFATLAHGGSVLALDAAGQVYTAGAYLPPYVGSLPSLASAGAFQEQVQARPCWGSGIVYLPCHYQFVEKLDPLATQVRYATYLTGTYGATPAGIVVDAQGNAILAGTTNSADYPVTEHAAQTAYPAKAPAPPTGISPRPTILPPPATGFVTKLNASGSGLLWSTYLGGSGQDAISGLAVDAEGNVYVSGTANSSDLPGLPASAPAGCTPTANQGLGFVARISPDGAAVTGTALVYGAPVCTYAGCSGNSQLMSSDAWTLGVDAAGNVVAGGLQGALVKIALSGSERLACLADSADNVQVSQVAPGQLLSLFGDRLGGSGGLTVKFQGVDAPILYASAEQVNVQVPYAMAGESQVELEIADAATGLLERRTVGVAARQPSVFLAADALLSTVPGYFYCGYQISRAQHALAIHSDGTLNSCEHGAAPGSTVTIFVNGLGPVQPALGTGETASGPAVSLSPAAEGAGILSTTTSPGSISGLAQIQVQVGAPGFYEVRPVIGGVAAREPIGIWVAAP